MTLKFCFRGGKTGESFGKETLEMLIREFHNRHKALFGWADPAMAAAVASIKLHAIAVRRPIELIQQPVCDRDPSAAFKRKRQVYFKELGGFVETPCYNADQLRHGNVIIGPAIVEAAKTTAVVPQGAELTVDAHENYIIKEVNQ